MKSKPKVYLAGGFRSGWQEIVKAQVPDIEYFDPSQHGLTDPVEYTAWDMLSIRESDLVFAYMEKDNPSGLGLALIGTAALLLWAFVGLFYQ